MASYTYKCEECGENITIESSMKDIKTEYRRKCPVCGVPRKFTRNWMAGIASYHSNYSPMHPRVNRGKGNRGVKEGSH